MQTHNMHATVLSSKYRQGISPWGDVFYILRWNKEKDKPLALPLIKKNVKQFLKYAKNNQHIKFNVQEIKKRTPKQVAGFFIKRTKNVIIPKSYVKYCRSLEERFIFAWRKRYGDLPQPKRQYVFHPDRDWPFDFAWPKYKLAVEIHGGSFIFGGHNRGKSQANDFEKANHAIELGWKLLAFNTFQMGQVDDGKLFDCVDFVAAVLTGAE